MSRAKYLEKTALRLGYAPIRRPYRFLIERTGSAMGQMRDDRLDISQIMPSDYIIQRLKEYA